jgi:S-DNA-T family DNA segregation ATPase FtsK/SpoIIIE
MNTIFHEKKRSLWYVGVTFYTAMVIFLVMSLISYNVSDSSWLYISSEPGTVTNKGGFFGAQLAAMLFYLLGGASCLLLVPLLCGLFLIIQGRSLKNEWERLCASLYIVCVGAALLATYSMDCSVSPYPGGMMGLLYAKNLVYYFDPLGRMLFLYTTLCASLIVLFRWSFMFLVQYAIWAVQTSYALMCKYHVVSKTVHAVGMCIYVLFARLPRFFVHFLQSLFDGAAFDETGLLHPEDDHDYDLDAFSSIPDQQDEIQLEYALALLRKNATGRIKENIVFVTLSLSRKAINDIQDGYTACVRVRKVEKQKTSPMLTKKVLQKQVLQKQVSQKPISQKPVSQYALPHMDIFISEKQVKDDHNIEKELQDRAQVLQDKLKRFGVNGEVVAIKRGPVVTLFEYQPDIDTKLSKIIVLEDDLAMALQAMSIRIIAPIPGRSVVGFEVANTTRHDVLFSQVTTSSTYTQFAGSLPLVLGKGTIGEVVVVDLARMPHLLIAGSTGSGKSVALNAILISLLCKLSPDDLKLILIDPKRLEFAAFTDIAHLLFPIVTSPHHAAPVLRWVVQEMEERYEKMAQCGARNIGDYILRQASSFAKASQDTQDDREEVNPMPYIVVVIDELADLMITTGRDIEDLITRITQMARAAGIHMIVATQRPSVDVITGLIKANFPSRISFRVASRIDSRTILDTMGADRLLGRGDMLFLDASTSQLRRVHGAYVSDKEIEQVADHIRQQRKVEYLDMHQVTALQAQELASTDDVLYKDVREFLDEIDEVSISLLQRKFRIGYNRSARIIDMLESQGLIMPQDGGKTRKVIR